MILTFTLGDTPLSIELSSADLGHVIDVLAEDRSNRCAPAQPYAPGGYVEGPTQWPEQINALVQPWHENGHKTERQHLQAPKLDDDDALARIAFDAYMVATNKGGMDFDDSVFKSGWRAVGGAVRAAALLAAADRALEDA